MLREALGKLHQVKANFTPVGISGERCAAQPMRCICVCRHARLRAGNGGVPDAAAAAPALAVEPLHHPSLCLHVCVAAAMEDFIGRGDRRIGAVIRRAWELGATNDSWWVATCRAC